VEGSLAIPRWRNFLERNGLYMGIGGRQKLKGRNVSGRCNEWPARWKGKKFRRRLQKIWSVVCAEDKGSFYATGISDRGAPVAGKESAKHWVNVERREGMKARQKKKNRRTVREEEREGEAEWKRGCGGVQGRGKGRVGDGRGKERKGWGEIRA